MSKTTRRCAILGCQRRCKQQSWKTTEEKMFCLTHYSELKIAIDMFGVQRLRDEGLLKKYQPPL